MKKRILWAIGTVILAGIVGAILFYDVPILLFPDLPFVPFFKRCFYILLLSSILCLLRIIIGPSPADRAVAIDILGILIFGFCAVLSVPTGRGWYLDIGIAWGLQSFIATIALAKYLEGRNLDD